MALAKKHRLTKKDLERVFKQGKTVKGSFFFIRFLKNDRNCLRTAVIIPAKVAKKSTVRNRIKRIFTELIRSGHFLENPYDIVIIATANIVEKQSKEINRDLQQTLNNFFGQL